MKFKLAAASVDMGDEDLDADGIEEINHKYRDKLEDITTLQRLADYFHVPVAYLKGYTVYTCTRCGSYFIPEPNVRRSDIQCCPYCMNPYFKEDNLQK